MSLIDNVLILTDCSQGINLDEILKKIPEQKKQIITSVLGRLTAKKLLDKILIEKNLVYNITKTGRDKINIILESIKKYSPDGDNGRSWQIVIFDIPEKLRSSRDSLRNYLISLGFGKLQDSIWISYQDQMTNIQEVINLLNIPLYVTKIQTKKFTIDEEMELVKKITWDWKAINLEYKNFIDGANKFLKNKNKNSYDARKLVFQFAKNMYRDPKLPENIQPKNSLTNKAYNLYLKIRQYCY